MSTARRTPDNIPPQKHVQSMSQNQLSSMHQSHIRTVSGDGRVSPKSPMSPQQTIETTNAELLTHALSQAPIHQLNSESYMGTSNNEKTVERENPMVAMANRGVEATSDYNNNIVGATMPKRVFPTSTNSHIISRHQLTQSRPRLSGGQVMRTSGAKYVQYQKGNTDSNNSRELSKVASPDGTQFQQTLNTSKEGFTLRGHLESLESAIVEMVSELKYHRHQVGIISAEKDTSGAVAEMNIVQAKNAILNIEYKLEQEVKRADRQQGTEYDRIHRQMDMIQTDSNTQNTRLLQLQRRIYELQGFIGLSQEKFS